MPLVGCCGGGGSPFAVRRSWFAVRPSSRAARERGAGAREARERGAARETRPRDMPGRRSPTSLVRVRFVPSCSALPPPRRSSPESLSPASRRARAARPPTPPSRPWCSTPRPPRSRGRRALRSEGMRRRGHRAMSHIFEGGSFPRDPPLEQRCCPDAAPRPGRFLLRVVRARCGGGGGRGISTNQIVRSRFAPSTSTAPAPSSGSPTVAPLSQPAAGAGHARPSAGSIVQSCVV